MKSPDESLNASVIRIRPVSGGVRLNLGDLWEYRELLYFLVWRDLKVRYKQTVLGAAWAIIQPLFLMLVFTVFFGRLIGVPSEGLPYSIFAYTALLPWQLFARALSDASVSLVANERVITKVYFPRLLVPAAAVISSLVDFAIAFVLLLGMMLFYGVYPGSAIIALPVFILLVLIAALGVGFWLSALNAIYRDVRYTLPFLTQLWMFATPVAYPSSLLHEPWRTLYGLNPMAGVVEGFRWALLGNANAPGPLIWASAAAALVILVSGAFYFRRMERTFADVV